MAVPVFQVAGSIVYNRNPLLVIRGRVGRGEVGFPAPSVVSCGDKRNSGPVVPVLTEGWRTEQAICGNVPPVVHVVAAEVVRRFRRRLPVSPAAIVVGMNLMLAVPCGVGDEVAANVSFNVEPAGLGGWAHGSPDTSGVCSAALREALVEVLRRETLNPFSSERIRQRDR